MPPDFLSISSLSSVHHNEKHEKHEKHVLSISSLMLENAFRRHVARVNGRPYFRARPPK